MKRDANIKEITYRKMAVAHARIKQMGGKGETPLPTIAPGTSQWFAWQRYFIDHLGFEPYAMKRVTYRELSQELPYRAIA